MLLFLLLIVAKLDQDDLHYFVLRQGFVVDELVYQSACQSGVNPGAIADVQVVLGLPFSWRNLLHVLRIHRGRFVGVYWTLMFFLFSSLIGSKLPAIRSVWLWSP